VPSRRAPPPAAAESALRRGTRLLNDRKFAAARRVLREAVLARDDGSAWALQEWLQTFVRKRKAAEAEAALRELLPEGDPLLDHGLGYLYRRTGRVPEARAALERAAAVRTEPWAPTLELGWLACVSGDPDRGTAMLREAVARFHARGDVYGEASALTHLGTWLVGQLRLADATQLLADARRLKEECGEALGLATVIFNIAIVYYHQGDYFQARNLSLMAERAYRICRFAPGVGAALNLLGNATLELGDPRAAAATYRRALRHAGSGPGGTAKVQEGVLRANLARACDLAQRHREAASQAQRAVDLSCSSGNPDALATSMAPRVQALEAMGQGVRALGEIAAMASRIAEASARSRADVARSASEVALRIGNRAQALELGQEAVRACGELEGEAFSLVTIASMVALARAQHATSDAAGAEATLLEATRALDTLLAQQRSPAARMGVMDESRRVADAEVATLAASGRALAAWEAARRAKARELRDAAVRRRGRDLQSAHPDLVGIQAEIGALSLEASLDVRARRRLADLRERHGQLLDAESRPATGNQRLCDVGPRPGEIIVEYHVAERETHVFIASARGLEVARLGAGQLQLHRAMARLLGPLGAAMRSGDVAAHLAEWRPDLAARLRHLLLGHALARGREFERLTVVPSGPLHGLPFDLLFADESLDEAPFEIATTPSLDDPGRPEGRGRGCVAIAWSPPRVLTLRSSGADRALGPLPLARSEARAIADIHAESELLLGSQATPARFLSAIGRAQFIHVAAHAFSDDAAPALSGIVLGGTDGASVQISADRIARDNLMAELVTLSACDTAAGPVRSREGTLSLARAFLEAGALRTLASPWPVDDRIARVFMLHVHRALAAGMTHAAAVKTARAALRSRKRDPLASHPVSWAGWLLSERRGGT
jgi:tetratricopeptide (TPR) repeat protein